MKKSTILSRSKTQENRISESKLFTRLTQWISLRWVLIYFVLMAAVYFFSLFGAMLSSPDFTYAEF